MQPISKTDQKNNNNNNLRDNNNKQDINHKPTEINHKQMTLDGEIVKPMIKNKFNLTPQQMNVFETFYANPNFAVSPALLYRGKKLHYNTVLNFIKFALENKMIKRCKIIKGKRVVTWFQVIQHPNTLNNEVEQLVRDNRNTFYQITEYGTKVYEMLNGGKNEEVS